jgi:hypothetical protein
VMAGLCVVGALAVLLTRLLARVFRTHAPAGEQLYG